MGLESRQPSVVDAPARDDSDGAAAIARRDFLHWGALAASFGLTAAYREAHAASGDETPELKLVKRLTYGITAEELALVQNLGYDGYLEYHLAYESIDDSALEARLAAFTTLGMTAYELYQQTSTTTIINQLTDATIARQAFSKRQFFERMVEFWTDHLNIHILDSDCRYLKTVDDREVIRRHALGRVPDLILASMHSPAMLVYLDNNTNRRTGPNENYARELMELHTLGVGGGYSQQDVVEVARCLTGWTLYGVNGGTNRGNFLYNPNVHDNGQKQVLGNIIAAGGGYQDGIRVHSILMSHPSTPRFIAKKLVSWLWGPGAPQALIDQVVSAYGNSGGDVKAMVRVILSRNWLALAPPKLKRPVHLAASMIRATNATVNGFAALRNSYLVPSGHLPFRWPPPDGFPDTFDFWSGLLLARWNIGFAMAANQIGSITTSLSYLNGGSNTAAGITERINQVAFAGTMNEKLWGNLEGYLLPNPPSSTKVRDAWGLALASPDFQYW